MNGLFVTGSDTEVGKTIFSALLLLRAQKLFPDAKYIKAIQCGPERDASLVASLTGVNASEIINLRHPLSPHLAALKVNTSIDFLSLVNDCKKNMNASFQVVEGAGGLMVPINRRHFIIDLARDLGLPTVLVARAKLGTINHILLSLAALREREIPVAGVVMIGPPNRDHEMTIKHYGHSNNVFSLPWLSNINPTSMRKFSSEHQEIFDCLLKKVYS